MKIEELKELPQWINWNYNESKDGKKTKVPISYNGQSTGTNEKYNSTWTTYEKAYKSIGRYDGIGVVFTNGLCGIDIDHKKLDDPLVKDIISIMDTYAELSPSKNGYHLLFTVDINKLPTYINEAGELKLENKYYQKNPHNQVECYIDGLTNRYFTFTGNSINNKDICERTEQLLMLLDKYMLKDIPFQENNIYTVISNKKDDEIIDIIRKSKQADKFSMLYDQGDISLYDNDSSSADMGLVCILAYYTKDFEQIDRIFKTSKLYRDKWERKDYKYSTITKALKLCNENNSANKNLEYISAKELQNKDLPPTIYYVDKILPQGLNLICSVPKMR